MAQPKPSMFSQRNKIINKHKMIQLIKEQYPNEIIEFNMNGTGELQLYILRPRKGGLEDKKDRRYKPLIILSIPNSSSWVNIQKCIETRLQIENKQECSICFYENTDSMYSSRIFCIQCVGEWCLNCHLLWLIKNGGVVICPFCRHSNGKRIPSHLLERKIGVLIERSRIMRDRFDKNHHEDEEQPFLMDANFLINHTLQEIFIFFYCIYFFFVIYEIFIIYYIKKGGIV
jgi:hypothetical protein